MSLEGLLIFLVIGLIAGWLAGQVMKGGGFVAEVINAFIGAVILLFILRLIKR